MCKSHVNYYMITCGGQERIASGLSRLYRCNDGRESFIIKCNDAQGLNVDDFGEVGLAYSA